MKNKSKKQRVLTIEYYEPHEMAQIKEGNHVLHMGNYWDFHAGCSGTVMYFKDGTTIDFDKEWTESIRRPHAVAEMISKKIGATVKVKYRKTPITC